MAGLADRSAPTPSVAWPGHAPLGVWSLAASRTIHRPVDPCGRGWRRLGIPAGAARRVPCARRPFVRPEPSTDSRSNWGAQFVCEVIGVWSCSPVGSLPSVRTSRSRREASRPARSLRGRVAGSRRLGRFAGVGAASWSHRFASCWLCFIASPPRARLYASIRCVSASERWFSL